jgi:hypothetical protein
MRRNIGLTMVLMSMFGVGGCAHKPLRCTNLNLSELAPALGAGVAIQPVFAAGNVKGWRIYNLRNADQLKAHGIGEGTMVTQVCGIPAGEIQAKGAVSCCDTDASREFEVTFDAEGQQKKVMIRRP